MKFRTLPESINYILSGVIETAPAAILTETFEDRVARARKIVAEDLTFLDFIRMGTDPTYKLSGLKEGMPSKIKLERTVPAGISDSTLRQEYRRIKGFLPNGAYATLKPVKREEIWTTLLEGVHWKEAVIATALKDQTLYADYPELENVLAVASGKEVLKEIPPTTIAPNETVKEVLKMKIDIDTGTALKTAAVAGVEAFDNRPKPTNTPVWTPAGTNGVPLLEMALTTQAPVEKKKRNRKKKSDAPVLTYKLPDDENELTKAEYDEMVALSDALRDERNTKMNALNTSEEVVAFLADHGIYSAAKLKALREAQLLKRKEQ